MAPLLEEQMFPDKHPFSFVGTDYFGPLIVKAGRTYLKRYGCLFTCITTKAVHLEVTNVLTVLQLNPISLPFSASQLNEVLQKGIRR